MSRRLIALLLLPLVAFAAVPDPGDFVRAWIIPEPESGGPVLEIELGPEVYQALARDDLRDLMVFDGDQSQGMMSPAPRAPQAAAQPEPEPVPVPWFGLPVAAAGDNELLRLRLERDAEGRLRRLDTDVGEAASDAGAVLVDLSQLDDDVVALDIAFNELPEPGIDARVSVLGSDDLGRWTTLARGLPLVSLKSAGLSLERSRLEFPATSLDYLKLEREDLDASLPLARVAALPAAPRAAPPDRDRSLLPGTAVPGEPGVFRYRTPGPVPVDQLEIRLADPRAAAQVDVASRSSEDSGWASRGGQVVFSLDNDLPGNFPLHLADATRDREWQLVTRPPQSQPPALRVGWIPERFLVTRGIPPMRLVAGSARAVRPDHEVSVEPLLATTRQHLGQDWQPPLLRIEGSGSELGGATALQPAPRPLPWRQVLLWSVLAGGAALLIGLVLRLLREPSAP